MVFSLVQPSILWGFLLIVLSHAFTIRLMCKPGRTILLLLAPPTPTGLMPSPTGQHCRLEPPGVSLKAAVTGMLWFSKQAALLVMHIGPACLCR
jgi:hypothetical protein